MKHRLSKCFGALLLLAVIILPFFGLVFVRSDIGVGSLEELFGRRQISVLLNSLLLSLSVATASVLVGILFSYFVNFKWLKLRLIVVLSLISLTIPPFIHAGAWDSFFAFLDTEMHFNVMKSGGFFASFWSQMMCFMPIAIILIAYSVKSASETQVRQARVLIGDIRTWLFLQVSQSVKWIIASWLIVFLLSLVDYSVPTIFQYDVFPLEVMVYYSATADATGALIMSVPLLLLMIVPVILLVRLLAGLKSSTSIFRKRKESFIADSFMIPLQILVGILFVLEISVPVFSLLSETVGESNGVKTIVDSWDEISFSLMISFFAAVFGLLIAFPVADYLRKRRRNTVIWILVFMAFLVPAPVTGVSVIRFMNTSFLSPLYEGALPVILVSVFRFLPLMILLIYSLDPFKSSSVLRSSRLLIESPFKRFFYITIPGLIPVVFIAFSLFFILSLAETGGTLLCMPPGSETLSVKIFNYLHYGSGESVAALSLFMVMMIFLVAFSGIWAFSLRRKFSKTDKDD